MLRRLDLYGLALESVKVQDAETLAALEAYSAGVNAWIEQINTGARGRGAPEFWLFEPEIAAWAPADSIAILKLMALQLTDQAELEVKRARLSMLLTPERLADILPRRRARGLRRCRITRHWCPARCGGEGRAGAAGRPAAVALPGGRHGGRVERLGRHGGTVGRGRRAFGQRPAPGLTAPTIWYLARLELASGGVIGGTLRGCRPCWWGAPTRWAGA